MRLLLLFRAASGHLLIMQISACGCFGVVTLGAVIPLHLSTTHSAGKCMRLLCWYTYRASGHWLTSAWVTLRADAPIGNLVLYTDIRSELKRRGKRGRGNTHTMSLLAAGGTTATRFLKSMFFHLLSTLTSILYLPVPKKSRFACRRRLRQSKRGTNILTV